MEPPFEDDGLTIPEPKLEPSSDSAIAPKIVIDNTADEHRVAPDPKPKKPVGEATCIALIGARGGVGTTTLAIQMAYDLAKNLSEFERQKGLGSLRLSGGADPRICLIDLDFETGACATYLDMPPAVELSDLCAGPDRIDAALTRALMSTHDSGVALLSVKNSLGANAQVNGHTVLALLDAAAQMYDYVFIDMPRLWCGWTQAAISAADHVAVVTELTIPALHMCRARIDTIEATLDLPRPCEVILNQVERRSFRNALKVSDADKALKRGITGVVCVDADTVREAINCGEPVGAVRAEARYVRDVRGILRHWDLLPHKEKSTRSKRHKDRRKSPRRSARMADKHLAQSA